LAPLAHQPLAGHADVNTILLPLISLMANVVP